MSTAPRVILNPEPINVDARIQQAQQLLADGLPWLTTAFGRAWRMPSTVDGKQVYYPAVYSGKDYPGSKSEYYDVRPNDALPAFCFFIVKDKAEPKMGNGDDYQPRQFNQWHYPVDIVFWMNLNKVDGTKKYPFVENLLAGVRAQLRKFSAYTVGGVYYDPAALYKEYDAKEIIKDQYLAYPYAGFRIEGAMDFLEQDVFNQCNQ